MANNNQAPSHKKSHQTEEEKVKVFVFTVCCIRGSVNRFTVGNLRLKQFGTNLLI